MYSGIYERLVSDEGDVLGQIDYSIYKKRKREFVMRKQAELGCSTIPDDAIEEFIKDQTDYTLELYTTQAENLVYDFLDASYGEQLAREREELEKEYRQKYEEFRATLQPRSWWYGVWQSFAASFFFVLAGYILLRMTGSWEALLGSLLNK